MPVVKKDESYVNVAYELICGYERATALADDLNRLLHDDKGFSDAKDDTRGFDRNAIVIVSFATLKDANRLDAKVRELLGRTISYTYKAEMHTAYGSRGPEGYVTAKTTVASAR